MGPILLRALLPTLARNRVVVLVIRHTGVALLAGIGARLGSDIYDLFKKRTQDAAAAEKQDATEATRR